MKYLIVLFTFFVITQIILGDDFKSIKVDYAKKAQFVNQLSKINLTKIDLKSVNLSNAVSIICRGETKSNQKPIVNYAVSFPTRTNNADPFSDDPIEKAKVDPLVTYKGDNVSFTNVLDSLCADAGYVWSISDDGKGNSFILIEQK